MREPCPFCGQPIIREYGSFRCKYCAKSSEDVIEQERKSRLLELKKARQADVEAAPRPKRAPGPRKAAKGDKGAEGGAAPKRAQKALSGAAKALPPAPPASEPPKAPLTKSARLRMVASAAAKMASRKPGSDEVGPGPRRGS